MLQISSPLLVLLNLKTHGFGDFLCLGLEDKKPMVLTTALYLFVKPLSILSLDN
jgi:hypothetical protein